MFKEVLVPLDGSEHSLRALEVAVEIAKKFNSRLTLIHVYSGTPIITVSPIFISKSSVLVHETASIVEANRKAGSDILAEGEKRASNKGVQAEKMLSEGHIVEELLKTVKTGEFGLVVMGARGLSTIKEILLGSVSHGVITHSSCPVLVVK